MRERLSIVSNQSLTIEVKKSDIGTAHYRGWLKPSVRMCAQTAESSSSDKVVISAHNRPLAIKRWTSASGAPERAFTYVVTFSIPARNDAPISGTDTADCAC